MSPAIRREHVAKCIECATQNQKVWGSIPIPDHV